MKKRWLVMLALAGTLALTAACGEKETAQDTETAAEEETTEDTEDAEEGIASAYPDSSITKLGTYTGVEVAKVSEEEIDSQLQEEIDELLDTYADSVTTDKTTVEDGDIVNIDFVGKKDGEAFDGGSSEGYELEIGSDSFIDGFEDGLIGATVGSTVELPLTFPENYGSTELAGQDVVFEVTINAIVEHVTPEWNDEFAAENTDYSTTAEYEEAEREILLEDAASEKEYQVMQAIVDDSEFSLADTDVQELVDTQTEQYETYASYYSMELEEFLTTYVGLTQEEFDAQLTSNAEFQISCTLVVDAIVKAENMTLTDEEYQTGLESLAEEYQAESAEDFEEQYGRTTIENSLLYDKAIDFVAEQAVEV